jgi:hypothetical protein
VELAHACYENIIVQRQEKCDSQSFFTSLLVLFTVQRSKPELCSGLQIVRQWQSFLPMRDFGTRKLLSVDNITNH